MLLAGAVACLVMASAAAGVQMRAAGGKPVHGKVKPKSKPKCKVVRRRRGKKWVKVKVCPKPASSSTPRPAAKSSGSTTKTSQSPTLVPVLPTASAPSSGGPGGSQLGASTTNESAPSVPAGPSAWDEPALVDPTVITLSATNRSLTLNQSQDYIVECPTGQFDVPGKITIWGGHNVVLQNCDESVTAPNGDWAGYLEDQTGTLWIDDVHFGGVHLTGGVQMQEPNATVVMRDVLFDTVYGSYTTNHAECIQTWSGPSRFLIDGLQCPTTYQGLFLLPNQHDSTTTETTWDFRNVQIDGNGAYDLWLGNVQPSQQGSLPLLNLENVYDCGPGEPRDWDGTTDAGQAWRNVNSCPSGAGPAPVWSNPDGSVAGRDDGVSPSAVAGEQP